ncbi:MAG: hypothetical protein ACPGQO_04815, partial [Candidatus Poseidoniaceae archaeon]
AAGAALADAQQIVGGAASLEDFGEALQATTLARDEARMAYVAQLDAALALHVESGAEAQRGRLQQEAARLSDVAATDPPDALGAALTRRLRLEHLHTKLLPVLEYDGSTLATGFRDGYEETNFGATVVKVNRSRARPLFGKIGTEASQCGQATGPNVPDSTVKLPPHALQA